MDALTFLDQSAKSKRQPISVLAGDEDFLKRLVREAIVHQVLGAENHELAVSPFSGESLDFTTVRDELNTVPFLGDTRVVIVENADPFITKFRDRLEKYFAEPSKSGVLILEAKTFPETTRLAKQLPDAAKLQCKSPSANKLLPWCMNWAKMRHNTKLGSHAGELLIELVGPQLGLLAQEIEKLSTAAGKDANITPQLVESLIGRSRSANVFHILNAIGDGRSDRAIGILTEVFSEGDEPIAVLGALTSQLRKLAAVARLTQEGQSLGTAMDLAGVPKWPEIRQNSERQLRHLGRSRLNQLMDWLIEINLGVKGGSALPNRMQVERLIVRLAVPRPS